MIATAYKLTTQDMTTRGGCRWTLGKWKRDATLGPMCDKGGYHAYTSPELALLLNPIHADISNPRLFRAEVDGESASDRGLKTKHQHMRLVEEISLPACTIPQRVYFAIRCGQAVCKDAAWNKWAEDWISGRGRTESAAREAAREAARAAALAAAYAAELAAEAARAADAARAAREAALAAAYAAELAAEAAREAARAAALAAAYAADIDLDALAREALAWIDPLGGEV